MASPGDLSQLLVELRPDVALAAIAVCDNVAHESPRASIFDWRQLELVRRLMPSATTSFERSANAIQTSESQSFE